ncbi:MAG TPA: HAD-IB family phosphatase [Acidimicrobiales bacterium]|nr:HAD-IB family phosphatase [Acidimicrobiales bacterium]
MNLAEASVFFDFDGTISTTDIGVYLLDKLAPVGWTEIGTLFEAGEIGSRECLEREWACIPDHIDAATRRAVASEVPLDPGFGPLVEGLRAAGAEIAVVSDGFGYYVHDFLAPFGVPVFTNELDISTGALRYPNADPECEGCAKCGTCKPRIINEAAARGRTTVFVGDGISDRHAARVADVLFAKAGLAVWCEAEGIAHTRFETLAYVAAAMFAPQ